MLIVLKDGAGTKVRDLQHAGVAASCKVRDVNNIAKVAMCCTGPVKVCYQLTVTVLMSLVDDEQAFFRMAGLELPHQEDIEIHAHVLESVMECLVSADNFADVHDGSKTEKVWELGIVNDGIELV